MFKGRKETVPVPEESLPEAFHEEVVGGLAKLQLEVDSKRLLEFLVSDVRKKLSKKSADRLNYVNGFARYPLKKRCVMITMRFSIIDLCG